MSLSSRSPGSGSVRRLLDVDAVLDAGQLGARGARRVLDQVAARRPRGPLVEPADVGPQRRARPAPGASAAHSMSPRETSRSSSSSTVTDIGGNASSTSSVEGVDAGDPRAARPAAGRPPRRRRAARRPPPGRRGRGSRGGRRRAGARPTGPAAARCRSTWRSAATSTSSRYSSSGGPSYHGAASERSTTLSPLSAEIGIAAMSGSPTRRPKSAKSPAMASELELVPVDEVHLVDGGDEVGHAEQRGDERVPLGLLDDAVAGVDQHDRDVGGDCAGDHVARVADVAGRVGEDERAPRGGEEAVGDVDRDALLALGPQAVGEQREVEPPVAALAAGQLDRVELVVEDRAACRAAGGRSACSCRRRPSPRWRRAGARAARPSGSAIRNSPRACGPPSRRRRRGRRRASRRAR